MVFTAQPIVKSHYKKTQPLLATTATIKKKQCHGSTVNNYCHYWQ